MQTITTYDAHCGTAVKHEQPGSCSTKYGNKNNRTNHGGGIARRLMPLLLFIFALVGGTAWGQTVTVTNSSATFECGKTYNVSATNGSRNGTTYTFTNSTGGDITISNIKVNTLSSTAGNYYYVKIGDVSYGNGPDGYSNSTEDACHSISFFGTYYIYPQEIDVSYPLAKDASVEFQIFNNISNIGECQAGFSFTVTTPACCPVLTAPADGANIISSIISSGSDVPFSWEAYADPASYDVVLDGATIANDITATSYTSVLDAGDYTWKVVPNIEGVSFNHCPTRSFKVCTSAPSCATNISLENEAVLNNRLVIWDAVECATSYEVFVAPISIPVNSMFITENGKYKYLVGKPTEPQFMMPILPEGEYRWVVRPKNNLGVATGCEMRTFKVKYKSAAEYSATPSTQGKEFFFSLMENGYHDNSTSNRKYKAIIAPKEDATVTFHYYADNTNSSYTVTAGTTREIELSKALVYHDTPGEQLNRTVHVTSTADISLYISNEADNSFDASIVLPTTALGADYMIQTYPSNTYNGERGRPCFMIIATEDNTVVDISGTNSNSITPAATTKTLNEGESYFVGSSAIID